MTPSLTHTTVEPVRYGGSVRPKLPTQTPSTSVMAFLGPCFWKLPLCAGLSPLTPSATTTTASVAAYRNIELMSPPFGYLDRPIVGPPMARWFPHRRPQWHRAVDERRTRRNPSLPLSPDADDLRLMVIAGSRLPEQPML